MVDEHAFWSTREPGIRSLSAAGLKREITRIRGQRQDWVAEYEAEVARTDEVRRLLSQGQYPQMNEGNADLYKAFCWRFWSLVRNDGAIGVVLPRTALSGAGMREWREEILDSGSFDDVTTLLNRGGWVFDDVHQQYVVGLVSIKKGQRFAGDLGLRGPFSSLHAYSAGLPAGATRFAVNDFRSWSEAASFPLLPTAQSADVFVKLRRHPPLGATTGEWRARPLQGDFNATTDKHLFILDEEDAGDSAWPVLKGGSFNLWLPDAGAYYAWAEPEDVTSVLQGRRVRGQRNARSPFSEFDREWAADPETLSCWYPRIAFRDVTNRLNSRTTIAALVPGAAILTNAAPYVLWPTGDERDEAYLLGVLCSMPLDWYARRVVERHLNFHLFNALPIPRPNRGTPLRRRVEELTGRMAAVDERYEHWADAVEVPVGSVTDDERPDLLAELDAVVALLYGLDESDLRIIYETFHETTDYSAHRERVLVHHRRLS